MMFKSLFPSGLILAAVGQFLEEMNTRENIYRSEEHICEENKNKEIK